MTDPTEEAYGKMPNAPQFSEKDVDEFAKQLDNKPTTDEQTIEGAQEIFKILAVTVLPPEPDGNIPLRGTAIEWNIITGLGEAIDNNDQPLDKFIEEVNSDMELLISGTLDSMEERKAKGASPANIYVDLLSGMTKLPVEVAHNMLATIMLSVLYEIDEPQEGKANSG